MMRSLLMGTAAVIALAASANAGSIAAKKAAHADRTLEVLYDQHGTDSGTGFVSQNFDSSFQAYSCQAADDFIVPKGSKFFIREVDVAGYYRDQGGDGGGPADSVDVTFYAHAKGQGIRHDKPGAVIKSFKGLHPAADNAGNFVLALPERVALGPGHYWMSVQANINFFVGIWYWENQEGAVERPVQWRNPGGWLGCPDWTKESECGTTGDSPGDHIFTLRGRRRG